MLRVAHGSTALYYGGCDCRVRRIDPDGRRQRRRNRATVHEAFGVSGIGRGQRLLPLGEEPAAVPE